MLLVKRTICLVLGLWPLTVLFSHALRAQSALSTPSFDCAKASTESEKLICQDAALAAQDRRMADAYYAVLRRLPPEQTQAFRHEHYEWSIEYRKACNSPMADQQRKACIGYYLEDHTKQLQATLGATVRQSADADLLSRLATLSVDSKVLKEIEGDMSPGESVVGFVERTFGCKLIFTTRRIVSTAPPLICRSTEWGEGWSIVIQGGNFQIPFDKMSSIVFAPSRINPREDMNELIKKLGTELSRSIWPYEVQLIGRDNKVLDRVYGVKDSEAQQISKMAATVHLRAIFPK
jgi:uncharacterized protein